jgi:hypothetical protein
VTVNSSVNFVIYCIFGEKFKRIFLKSLCTMVGNPSPHDDIMRYPQSRQGTCSYFHVIRLLIDLDFRVEAGKNSI